MTVKYPAVFEQNTGTLTTSATGAGVFTATKLRSVAFAIIKAPGYMVVEGSISGQDINFQIYQQSGTIGALVAPTAAVAFDPGTINVVEFGS